MRRNGFSLLEVTMALAISLVLMAAGTYAYRQHMRAAQINRAKVMLETIRQGIAMYRYRQGTFPPIGTLIAPATPSLYANMDDLGQAFYSLGPGVPLRDPLIPPSGAGPSPIVQRGDATASWGGWVYDPLNGTIMPNLPGAEFPGDPPERW